MPRLPDLFRLALAALLLLTATAVAQQADDAPTDVTADTQPPAPTAAPTRSTATRAQIAAEEALLPAYLQDDADAADTSGARADPWQDYNRRVYRFNKEVDRVLAKPTALAYQRVVPRPVRIGIGNFFVNLFEPLNAVHLLLQGHPGSAGKALARFAINTTIGIGGLLDPATRFHLPRYNEDFGQTLGRWGWRDSRYLVLPFLGPGTLRDGFGRLGDATLTPYQVMENDKVRVAVIGLSLVDTRVQLLPLDELTKGVEDDYVLVREAWTQRRNYQIADQTDPRSDDAPDDYLEGYEFPEDDDVPVDPMPDLRQ